MSDILTVLIVVDVVVAIVIVLILIISVITMGKKFLVESFHNKSFSHHFMFIAISLLN